MQFSYKTACYTNETLYRTTVKQIATGVYKSADGRSTH